jgi:magnesium chelatase family protein
MTDDRLGEASSVIQARVETARQIQLARFGQDGGSGIHKTYSNADMTTAQVRKHCSLDEAGLGIMKAASSQLQLSARAYHRILKLGRTIADLAGSETILSTHLAEALQYRPRLMEY